MIEIAVLAGEQDAEALADTLIEMGALSVAIEDADADSDDEVAIYGEPGSAMERHAWSRSRLRVLVDGEPDGTRLIEAAVRAIGLPVLSIENRVAVENTDWVRASQSQFPPTRISQRLWIVPTWHDAPDPDAVVVRLDPGVAFGTGTHPTTQLCLAWLDEHLTSGASVLDYGCGSGILTIAAGKLGARTLVGVDIDDQALVAARLNSESNGVTARYTDPDGLRPATYDVVLANILSNPLKILAPALLARVARGGALVLSGILERQATDLIATYRAADDAIELGLWRSSEGWACLTGRRTA